MRVRRAKTTTLVELEHDEAELLVMLTHQLAELLSQPGDLARERLLPSAYPDDAEAAREFRRFTESELVERKLRNAGDVVASLEAWPVVELNQPTALAWLTTLTDIRIVLATHLGIETDDDEGDASTDEGAITRDVYDWLGGVQGSLVWAVDR